MVWDKFREKRSCPFDPQILEDFLEHDLFSRNEQKTDFSQFSDLLASIVKLSTDDDPRVAMERALMTYKRILEHAGRGGQVKFVSKDGDEKTLKVRVRVVVG